METQQIQNNIKQNKINIYNHKWDIINTLTKKIKEDIIQWITIENNQDKNYIIIYGAKWEIISKTKDHNINN